MYAYLMHINCNAVLKGKDYVKYLISSSSIITNGKVINARWVQMHSITG